MAGGSWCVFPGIWRLPRCNSALFLAGRRQQLFELRVSRYNLWIHPGRLPCSKVVEDGTFRSVAASLGLLVTICAMSERRSRSNRLSGKPERVARTRMDNRFQLATLHLLLLLFCRRPVTVDRTRHQWSWSHHSTRATSLYPGAPDICTCCAAVLLWLRLFSQHLDMFA